MEIGKHCIARLELVRRIDENIRSPAAGGDKFIVALGAFATGDGFKRADRGRTATENPAAAHTALVDRRRGIGRYRERLEIHLVVFDVFRLDGPKSSRSHMKRDRDTLDALPAFAPYKLPTPSNPQFFHIPQ